MYHTKAFIVVCMVNHEDGFKNVSYRCKRKTHDQEDNFDCETQKSIINIENINPIFVVVEICFIGQQ